MIKNWYILQVQKGYETVIKNLIISNLKKKKLYKHLKYVFSLSEISNKKKNQFYGYIFLNVEINTIILTMITELSNVIGFIKKSNKQLAAISIEEVKNFLFKLEIKETQWMNLKTKFSLGEQVRIKGGPFLDYLGKITYINYKKNRVNIAISVFGRITAIDLEISYIEKE